MRARSIAKALGGDIVGPERVLAPGPGHSPADRSMSVLINPNARDGFLVTSFSGDDWRDCRQLLGLHGHESNSRPHCAATHGAPHGDRVSIASRLWHEARPIGMTLAENYLIHRGLQLGSEAYAGDALRFHNACPFRLAHGHVLRLPALVAKMVAIRTGEFCGVHRTALAPDGRGKAELTGLGNPKKMLGRAAGACVKLSPDEEVSCGLHIAEGIETALACIAMGFRPTWAALSAGGVATFPVLAGIETLTVFADHDANATGLKAARQCASQWSGAGREVTIALPPDQGRDWADDTRWDR
jgi:putative DNA primase/helicase